MNCPAHFGYLQVRVRCGPQIFSLADIGRVVVDGLLSVVGGWTNSSPTHHQHTHLTHRSWVRLPEWCVLSSLPGQRHGCTPSPWCSCWPCYPEGEEISQHSLISHINKALSMCFCIYLYTALYFASIMFLPAWPCWAEDQTPSWVPSLWTSSLHRCSGPQPETHLQSYPEREHLVRGREVAWNCSKD